MEFQKENQLRILKNLIQDLCTSGKSVLNEEKMKLIKKLCKTSDYYVIELYQIVMKYLRKQHSEIRLSACQICDNIFMRSHCFRELVLKNFTNFTDLTIGTNIKHPLPKPDSAAKNLRETAIGAIKKWYDKFRDGYLTLNLGFKFLRDCKNIDFISLAILTEQDRQRLEELRRKEEETKNKRIAKITEEMHEISDSISNTLEQFNNGFKLLIPDLHNFFISNGNDIDELSETMGSSNELSGKEEIKSQELIEFGSDWMREHGLNKETVIQVNLADIHKVQQTVDNEIIIVTLRELICDIEKSLLPQVRKWEKSILQYSVSQADLVRSIVDTKNKLERALKCYNSIKILPEIPKNITEISMDSDSDDDTEFVDVTFDDPRVGQAVVSEEILLGLESSMASSKTEIDTHDLHEAGPSGLNNLIPDIKNKFCAKNIVSKKIKKYIDIDAESSKLGDYSDPFSYRKTMTGLSQIWAANESLHDHEGHEMKSSGILGIATRPINYEREWAPIKWECRHPLSTNRLCSRKDRECCPFHGPIVPRDNAGKPLKVEDAIRDQKRLEFLEQKYPAWQDPSLLADIKANTGVDLNMKRVKERKKKYPNLTDLKKFHNTPRNRLSKKVFNKKSVKRVHKALNNQPL